MKKLRLAVVGVGHLGKEHARILSTMPDVELVGVVDARREQAEAIALRCNCRPFTNHQPLLDHIDAAVIATPTIYHHAVARELLSAGIPLLIEKPIAPELSEAEELVALATARGVVLQVGHIERFNPTFETLQNLSFQPKFIQSRRYSPYTGRSTDIGVVLDMMIHDLDLLLTMVGAPVRDVSALGITLMGGHEDIVQAQVSFANGCVAQVQASRVFTGPVRQMEVWSPEGLVCADFHTRRLTLMQPGDLVRQQRLHGGRWDTATLASLRTDLFGSLFEKTEWDCTTDQPDQLTRELQDFVGAVRTGTKPRVTGEHGRDAIALATRILACVERHHWNGESDDCCGPLHLPLPLGPLFPAAAIERAA